MLRLDTASSVSCGAKPAVQTENLLLHPFQLNKRSVYLKSGMSSTLWPGQVHNLDLEKLEATIWIILSSPRQMQRSPDGRR